MSLAIAVGREAFLELLAGAHAMDQHFRSAPWDRNLPVLMGLLGVWNINFLELPTLAVLPYDGRLKRFPAYLQQLDMESNGKSVTLDGEPLAHSTAPVIWGEPGNNAQHSFFQMLHQGTPRAALDFLLPAQSSAAIPSRRRSRSAIASRRPRHSPSATRSNRRRGAHGAQGGPGARRTSGAPQGPCRQSSGQRSSHSSDSTRARWVV